jgi:phospholipid/cholesterol/gamma-HCH transport system ATP-binding protein
VIFFDEPTTGLDPIMSGVINRLIRGIVTDMGATAVTITHDLRTVRDVADRVAMLHDGRVHWQGSAAEVDTADNPALRQFVDGAADGPIRTTG